MSSETKRSIGFDQTAIGLALVFITLKLTGHITWSWWWVLAPFWVPYAIAGLIMIVFLLSSIISMRIRDYKNKTRI